MFKRGHWVHEQRALVFVMLLHISTYFLLSYVDSHAVLKNWPELIQLKENILIPDNWENILDPDANALTNVKCEYYGTSCSLEIYLNLK